MTTSQKPLEFPTSKTGAFVRPPSAFTNLVTADGSSGFKAESGRYHLYVALACPWANRTLIMRNLKGLQDVISYTVVDWFLDENGWSFTDKKPKCTLDTLNNCKTMREVYQIAQPDYGGRVTVPVLWDKHQKTIVSNESADIIRILNTEFNEFCALPEQKDLDFYPEHLRSQIDEVNSWIYPQINNGVYKAGFAKSQEAYDAAVVDLFQGLDKAEAILGKSRFLTGSTMTEADIRLFTTLVRFDWVYHGHFKCNKKKLVEYQNLWEFTRDMYQTPGIGDTIDREHITKHYMNSHRQINPFGIVSIGPDLDFTSANGREGLN